MKRILLIVLIVNVHLIVNNCQAQDIHFSQTYFTPLELNPANAGAEFDLRAGLNYRTRWRVMI